MTNQLVIQKSTPFWAHASCLGIFVFLASLAPLSNATAAQTKSWVVSWFTMAMYSQDGDCPEGLNPDMDTMVRQQLRSIDKTPAEIEAFMKEYAAEPTTPALVDVLANRGRIDGKPVNAYTYPESVPDPQLHTVQGRYAYGFNLDGSGAASPNSFEDPETHERGVNNQLFRMAGCIQTYRAVPPHRSLYSSYFWDRQRRIMPAWLVSITGDDLTRDGDVTVTFDRALDQIISDAGGEVQRDSTFRLDTDPHSHDVFRGKLKDGVLSVEPGNFYMAASELLGPAFEFRQTHVRLKIMPDGSLEGIVGGYQSWIEIYYEYAVLGWHSELCFDVDVPGAFYALKRLADAYPDPKTGQNTHISVAYKLEAVPAFVVSPTGGQDNKITRAGATAGRGR